MARRWQMLTTTYTCDNCGKDISDRSDAAHRLALSEDHIWRDTLSTAPPPLLDREHHFCGTKCLYQWNTNRER
jgi:hypothetical protein